MGSELTTILRDTGFLGLALASFFYLSKGIYTLTQQRNGNGTRPKTITDLFVQFSAHAEEEREYRERTVAQIDTALTTLNRMESNIARLLGRGDHAQ